MGMGGQGTSPPDQRDQESILTAFGGELAQARVGVGVDVERAADHVHDESLAHGAWRAKAFAAAALMAPTARLGTGAAIGAGPSSRLRSEKGVELALSGR